MQPPRRIGLQVEISQAESLCAVAQIRPAQRNGAERAGKTEGAFRDTRAAGRLSHAGRGPLTGLSQAVLAAVALCPAEPRTWSLARRFVPLSPPILANTHGQALLHLLTVGMCQPTTCLGPFPMGISQSHVSRVARPCGSVCCLWAALCTGGHARTNTKAFVLFIASLFSCQIYKLRVGYLTSPCFVCPTPKPPSEHISRPTQKPKHTTWHFTRTTPKPQHV